MSLLLDSRAEGILELLRSKNRLLERLLEATRSFLSSPMESLVLTDEEGQTPLFAYERVRTTIIKTLQLHDREIDSRSPEIAGLGGDQSFLGAAKAELLRSDRIIGAVVNADEVVFARIREAQAQVGKLIQENRKSREILTKFKSGASSTGDGMDRTL